MKIRILIPACLFSLSLLAVKAQDSLFLDQAMLIALENNYGIVIARNEVKITDHNNTMGRAGMLPRLDLSGSLSGSVSNTHQVQFDGTVRDAENAQTKALNGGVALSWTLFDGFNMFQTKYRLRELQNLSETQLRSVIEGTMADVIMAYYDIVQRQKLAEVYHEALVISKERMKIAKAKLDVGSGSELSYLQSAVDMNADSAFYLQQLAAFDNSRTELNRLLCRDLETPFRISYAIPLENQLSYEELMNLVDNQNPDLQYARGNVTLASISRKQAKASLYPRISMSSGYNVTNSMSELNFTQSNRTRGLSGGLTATFNIFNGFNTQHNIAIARINEENAQKELSQTELSIKTQFRQFFNDYQTNLGLVAFENQNLILASRNFSIASEKYRLGAISDIELRETQQKMIDAESRYLIAQFQCKMAETELLRLSGQLSESLQ
jgi:outer membrane protein